MHGPADPGWEPQDSGSGTPTVENVYHDGQSHRMVEVRQKEQYGSSDTLREWTFYDGGGSLLQSQAETGDPNRVIVVDYSYDYKGRLSSVSVPYEVGQASGSYGLPHGPPARLHVRFAGKGHRVENPDGSQVQMHYYAGSQRRADARIICRATVRRTEHDSSHEYSIGNPMVHGRHNPLRFDALVAWSW